ncbi:hypothetical protein HDU88_009025 [Geranomyces variabilis]|nr:hypothetical protein HDU88_009025 [Geranomyces variabilis]
MTLDIAEVAKAYGRRPIRKLTLQYTRHDPPHTLPKSVAEWENILRHFPLIVELDFESQSILETTEDGDIVLDVASRCCPKLLQLCLASASHEKPPFITDSLKRWKNTNGKEGLVHFSVNRDLQPSAIMAIVDHCPHFLDYSGLMDGGGFDWDEFIDVQQHLAFTPEELERLLIAVAPSLKSFNLAQWLDIDARLFEAFQGKTFSKLKWLLVGNAHADYRSFDFEPEDLRCLPNAFPNLEHLQVAVETADQCQYYVDELFEPPFAETLARCCPKLRRLQLTNLTTRGGCDLCFDDDDFAHFGKMRELEDIELAPVVDCSTEAIFTLSQRPPGFQVKRRLIISRKWTDYEMPAKLAPRVLVLLANTPAADLKSRYFHMKLDFSEEAADKLHEAMARLRSAHATKDMDPERISDYDPPVVDDFVLYAWHDDRQV